MHAHRALGCVGLAVGAAVGAGQLDAAACGGSEGSAAGSAARCTHPREVKTVVENILGASADPAKISMSTLRSQLACALPAQHQHYITDASHWNAHWKTVVVKCFTAWLGQRDLIPPNPTRPTPTHVPTNLPPSVTLPAGPSTEVKTVVENILGASAEPEPQRKKQGPHLCSICKSAGCNYTECPVRLRLTSTTTSPTKGKAPARANADSTAADLNNLLRETAARRTQSNLSEAAAQHTGLKWPDVLLPKHEEYAAAKEYYDYCMEMEYTNCNGGYIDSADVERYEKDRLESTLAYCFNHPDEAILIDKFVAKLIASFREAGATASAARGDESTPAATPPTPNPALPIYTRGVANEAAAVIGVTADHSGAHDAADTFAVEATAAAGTGAAGGVATAPAAACGGAANTTAPAPATEGADLGVASSGVLVAFDRLVDSVECTGQNNSAMWKWSSTLLDMPKPHKRKLHHRQDEEEDGEEEESETPMDVCLSEVDVCGSKIPCNVTAFLSTGLVQERIDCTPVDGQPVKLRDLAAGVSTVLGFLITVDCLVCVWGPGQKFQFASREYAEEAFLLCTDGRVQCGPFCGGCISSDSNSFELFLMVLEPLATPQEDVASAQQIEFPLDRGIACVSWHSWRRLQSPEWFDDELCNAFLSQVNCATSEVCCVPSHFVGCLVAGAMAHVRLARLFIPGCHTDNAFWDRLPLLLFPVHVNGNHWALIAMECKAGCISLKQYDSLQKVHPSTRQMQAVLKEFRVFLRSMGWQGEIADCVEDGPQQSNGHDCGPYMLATALVLALGRALCDCAGLFENMMNTRGRIGDVIKAVPSSISSLEALWSFFS